MEIVDRGKLKFCLWELPDFFFFFFGNIFDSQLVEYNNMEPIDTRSQRVHLF